MPLAHVYPYHYKKKVHFTSTNVQSKKPVPPDVSQQDGKAVLRVPMRTEHSHTNAARKLRELINSESTPTA